ncbi:MAG: hypothetical protein JSR82_19920 [Verrucomicrobia bacterium]|nr:hypothetical protein [Verrucomicrobiota bacterium]
MEIVRVDGARIAIQYDQRIPAAQRPLLQKWVRQSAQTVAAYYGHFPMRQVTIRLRSRPGAAVSGGYASGLGGAHIQVKVGRFATRADLLEDDWMLTHEMIHLAFPNVLEKHHWIEEGIATYVEPIARVRAGVLPEERLWRELLTDTPQGLPARGDRGLDYTPTWGRIYWGGAIYCLLADVEIRRRTDNRFGLEHALRAINAAGGNLDQAWTLASTLAIGDAATGVPVLTELYERYKDTPEVPDLAHLWADLGVRLTEDGVVLDDSAPSAHIRRALTAPWVEPKLFSAAY